MHSFCGSINGKWKGRARNSTPIARIICRALARPEDVAIKVGGGEGGTGANGNEVVPRPDIDDESLAFLGLFLALLVEKVSTEICQKTIT